MSAWDVPAPPLPSQTGAALDALPRVVRRGELETVLEAARSSSDEIVAATVAQREGALSAEREKEREAREQEAREAALRAQVEALEATTSELRQDALLRGATWGLGLLSLGLLYQWASKEDEKRMEGRRQGRRQGHRQRRAS